MRKLPRWISAITMTVLLFTQLLVSAYGCPRYLNAKVFSPSEIAASSASSPAAKPCGEIDASQPLLCHQHCQQDDAAFDNAPAFVLPALHGSLAPLALPERAAVRVLKRRQQVLLHRETSPPLSISFCVFRT